MTLQEAIKKIEENLEEIKKLNDDFEEIIPRMFNISLYSGRYVDAYHIDREIDEARFIDNEADMEVERQAERDYMKR